MNKPTTTLSKTSAATLAKPHAFQKPITVKHVMILDTGDGAFTDESVKTKSHKSDAKKLVLKCTNLARLMHTVQQLGLQLAGPLVKGHKHHIAIVWKGDFNEALLAQANAQAVPALGPPTATALPAQKAKALKAK